MLNTGDPSVSPKKAGKTKMNEIGGTCWQDGGSGIVYEIEVKSDGLYELAFHFHQLKLKKFLLEEFLVFRY